MSGGESSLTLVKAMVPRPAPFGRGVALGDAATMTLASLGAVACRFAAVAPEPPQAASASASSTDAMAKLTAV